MPWDSDAMNAPHTCRELLQEDQPMTQEEFTARFVAFCLKESGETHFEDGQSITEYASDVAASYWSDPGYRDDGPEACAESDMSYWGES